ncbi:MAG: ParB N-terminal domain-containing protein [Hyphomonadaceae bacterium]|nr:ParB N-terminal domain-containing protein [Hyphomonadaceae bacterium]
MSESTSIQQIPLNRLSPSSLNVRKKDRKADIDALAASILAHGLLQNLNVVAKDEDKFEVVAGGRRLAALKALVKAGAIARDYAVPCKVVPNEQAREASLAEIYSASTWTRWTRSMPTVSSSMRAPVPKMLRDGLELRSDTYNSVLHWPACRQKSRLPGSGATLRSTLPAPFASRKIMLSKTPSSEPWESQ